MENQLLQNFDGLGLLIVLVVLVMIIQRRLHFETQAVFLLITRRADVSLALFSLLFFPGVLLHEVSHFLMARLLGVQTGGFSLIPQTLPDGRLRLGYVEIIQTDVGRDALIGGAPLLTGGAFVVYAGLFPLGLTSLWEGVSSFDLAMTWQAFSSLPSRPDFWFWFYLTFAVSTTMFPSPSDRRAWLPVAGVTIFLLVLSLLFGAGPWMLEHIAPVFNKMLRNFAVVLAVSGFVQVALLLPLWFARTLLSRLTGLNVQ